MVSSSSSSTRKSNKKVANGSVGGDSISPSLEGHREESKLITAHVWGIASVLPTNSYKSMFLPGHFVQKMNKMRLLTIETHLVYPGGVIDAQDGPPPHEECIVRMYDAINKETRPKTQQELRERMAKYGELVGSSTLVIRGDSIRDPDEGSFSALNSGDGASTTMDDDASTVAGVPAHFVDYGTSKYTSAFLRSRGWKPKYCFPVKSVTEVCDWITGKHLCVRIKLDNRESQVRDVIFFDNKDGDVFRKVLRQEHENEEKRDEQRLRAVFGCGETQNVAVKQNRLSSTSLPVPPKVDNNPQTYLLEMVSAWNLPAGDLTSSDPYVKCSINGTLVHQTKHISKTLDPIWTLKHDSFFLLTIGTRDLLLSEGLLCVVKDFDKVGGNETLGSVYIPPKTIYESKGERLEFKLGPPPGKLESDVAVPGYLAIRCRRASDYDIRFMKEYKETQKSESSMLSIRQRTEKAIESAGGAGNIKSILSKRTRFVRNEAHPEGVKEYKIRPGPDPKRVDETTWMTKKQIQDVCLEESHKWIDSGSGRLGRVFLEVLGCDDLPNLDAGGFAGNKTDAFVSVVYEDTAVKTDIIDDCLSPRWMPWTKRAFIFHMFHPSSQIFLGVFDYDGGVNPADDHDLVGRVSVDLSNLRKNTVYVMKYNIFTTAKMSQRKKKGTITIRFRLEIDEDRLLLLSSLEPPPIMYVNSKKRKDFKVIRYTCTGKYDMEAYSMKVINSYIEELLAFQHILFYLQDAIIALLMWRGTYPLTIRGQEHKIPVHSLFAFVVAVLLVERPHLLPSFFLFATAWVLLATMDYRRRLPDKWSHCKTYAELLTVMLTGESHAPPDSIAAYENYDEAQAFLEKWKNRITESEKAAARAYEESIKLQEEAERDAEVMAEATTDISTKRGGVSIDPFKPILFPVQQNLATLCRYLRHLKYVVLWEECYITFWVVTGCIVLGTMFLFLPWLFILRWTSRILVWLIFGPWMKLVDVFYLSQIQPLSEEEESEKREQERMRRQLASSAALTDARIKRENAVKLKAMKKYMFGRFITRVPVLKEDRYRDLPLPESTAVPFNANKMTLAELAMHEAGYRKTRLPGQHLAGVMIPKVEPHGFTEAPIGQATARPKLVDRHGPGGSVQHGPDSDVAAYTKIGSIVLAAGVLTWCGVPLLAGLTQSLLGATS